MNQYNTSFTGYDARPLRGVIFRDGFGAHEKFLHLTNNIAQILNKEGVDVFLQDCQKITKNNFTQREQAPSAFFPFAQDTITFTPDNQIITKEAAKGYSKNYLFVLQNYFKIPLKEFQKHISGGNFFFVKDGNEEAVILGNDYMRFYNENDRRNIFGNKRIYNVPQPDFHIDLSIRPLNKKIILVHDPELLLEQIMNGIQNAGSVLSHTKDEKIELVMIRLKALYENIKKAHWQHNMAERYNALSETLKSYKFEVISVPAAVERAEKKSVHYQNTEIDCSKENIIYDLNYMNAIVHERADGSLVYITNKSNLDKKIGITQKIAQKIGFSFEKMFTDSLRGIIKEEDIHFVGGHKNFIPSLLSQKGGGVHCLTAEIPKECHVDTKI